LKSEQERIVTIFFVVQAGNLFITIYYQTYGTKGFHYFWLSRTATNFFWISICAENGQDQKAPNQPDTSSSTGNCHSKTFC
jgi:hypothetical protein